MSVVTYVGARYVPKFSDKNGGNWDNQYSYEALEIVKNGNDYYTAKIPVPVGTLLTDTKYWALTGNYNGAIDTLQNEIDAINTYLRGVSVTPEMFGAVGDGITDDTAAVQAALDTGENVTLTGEYLITSDLVVKHDATWLENEKQVVYGGTLIMHNASLTGYSHFCGGTVFCNVCFLGDGNYTTPAILFNDKYIRTKFVLCKFRNIDYVAKTESASFCQEAQFINCHFQNGVTAIKMNDGQFAVKIFNCDINNYSTSGIELDSSVTLSQCVIEGNVLENNGIAIILHGILKAVNIQNNYFEGNNRSIDLTFFETFANAYSVGTRICDNFFFLEDNKNYVALPYVILHRLSDYVNGTVIPVIFDSNASTTGSGHTVGTYHCPNGTPNADTLDFKFIGFTPSSLINALHKYDVLEYNTTFTAASAESAGNNIRLMDGPAFLTAIGRSALPQNVVFGLRTSEVPGVIYVNTAGNIVFRLLENISIGQTITWGAIYK